MSWLLTSAAIVIILRFSCTVAVDHQTQKCNLPNSTDLNKKEQELRNQEREWLHQSLQDVQLMSGEPLGLEKRIMENGGVPIRNFVISTWRSGSTFLAHTLSSHPGIFYIKEPFARVVEETIRNGTDNVAKKAYTLLNNDLSCNYGDDLYRQPHVYPYYTLFKSHFWDKCVACPELCYKTKFLSNVCKMYPFQLVKTCRLRLGLAEIFFERYDAKIVYLVRDPRGTLVSRYHMGFFDHHPKEVDPRNLCADLVDNYAAAEKFRTLYPQRFMIIRYEDLSLKPQQAVAKILNFFDLHYHPQVKEYLETHTEQDHGGMFSTFRDSSTTPFHWREELFSKPSLLMEIQEKCREAFRLWGYVEAVNLKKLNPQSFNPLMKPPWPDMIV